MVVQIGAAAARRCKQIVAHRIVDDRLRQHAFVRERDRHRVLREAVQKIGGAVERIDDPLEFRMCRRRRFPLLESNGRDRPRAALRRSHAPRRDPLPTRNRSTAFCVTARMSRFCDARLMILPARRAAFTAVLSMGCIISRGIEPRLRMRNAVAGAAIHPAQAGTHIMAFFMARILSESSADPLKNIRVVLHATEPSRQYRRRGARDEDNGLDAAVSGQSAPVSASRSRCACRRRARRAAARAGVRKSAPRHCAVACWRSPRRRASANCGTR